MNRYGILSLLMVVINVSLFFLSTGPNNNLSFWAGIFCTLSTLGVVFAVISKKWAPLLAGIILNGATFAMTILLILASSLGECFC
ncbi:hypothetical protein J2S78_000141 [Salibacterium salarium]|uniref:hypothetical protein n=1 Tax=Salibacterium salarium TaxID=284579 RepID=UPI0027849EA7|nr:hypothetical protein [Salibacterium salarium]MDQ0297733.1 hypothetical protein [Salibacterium salarium]